MNLKSKLLQIMSVNSACRKEQAVVLLCYDGENALIEKTYVVCTNWNCLFAKIPMSTNNIIMLLKKGKLLIKHHVYFFIFKTYQTPNQY